MQLCDCYTSTLQLKKRFPNHSTSGQLCISVNNPWLILLFCPWFRWMSRPPYAFRCWENNAHFLEKSFLCRNHRLHSFLLRFHKKRWKTLQLGDPVFAPKLREETLGLLSPCCNVCFEKSLDDWHDWEVFWNSALNGVRFLSTVFQSGLRNMRLCCTCL